jgi:hypothetical protein
MHRMLIAIVTIAAFTALAAPADARRKGGPNGTFRNESGVIKLAYQGEGNVNVELKTKYCKLVVNGDSKARASTFVPTEGIAVHDAKGKPVLVIFYTKKKIVVWAELKRFKKQYCKVGFDATGVFKRSRK